MAAPQPGSKAPPFDLPALGGGRGSLAGMKKGERAVVAFIKATCPTCQLEMPFLEKLFRHHQGDARVRFLAVTQEEAPAAEGFNRDYGITMPTLLDSKPYEVSARYGLTHVPTLFVIDADGRVESTSVGFARNDLEALEAGLAGWTGKKPAGIFEGSPVPDFKPG
jgi:peroxiredoxin